MKLNRAWLPILILVLIAASAFVDFSKTHDTKTHRMVDRFPIHRGLDISGGVRAIMQVNLPAGSVYDHALVLKVLTDRVNSAGLGGEATVQPKGQDQYIIEIPDVKNQDAVLNMLGTTAQLKSYYFRDVVTDKYPDRRYVILNHEDGHYQFLDNQTKQTFRDGAQIKADFGALIKQGADARPGATLYTPGADFQGSAGQAQVYFDADQTAAANRLADEMEAWKAFLGDSPLLLTGNDIEPKSTARIGGSGAPTPVVAQIYKPSGTDIFARFTTAHVGELNGIVLDDKVLTVPIIEEPIVNGEAEINGFKTLQEAQNLADLLNAGALPVPLRQVYTQSVDATLGPAAEAKMLKAGLIGFALVVVFMLAMYRLPGLVASLALCIYSLFVMAIYRGGLHVLGLDAVTLSLAGIAGFILSIGMAVDANILIFERMKEELRNGKNLRAAIDAGFARAFPAIRDSNMCTAITCIVLLSIGNPRITGFAETLLIGVIISLFSAITVTRLLLYALVNAGIGTSPVLMGYKTEAASPEGTSLRWNIIGKRNYFYGLSLAIIVPGLVFWLGLHGLKQGIEFTGGTQMEVTFPQAISQQVVLKAMKDGQVTDPLVQMASGGITAIISTPEKSSDKTAMGENITKAKLEAALTPLGQYHEDSFDNILGVISKELTENAVEAVAIASGLIVFYLAFAFSIGGFVAGLRLGMSAIVALVHDVLVLMGVFAILGYYLNWKIDSYFVTAVLTVIGFSVHDTVVIFDRVRENLRHRKRGEDFEQLVNRSILQTFRRSVATSLTVLMTLGALIAFGEHTTLLLNVALFIGILSGTYSSIFNAASILVDWENYLARRSASGPAQVLAAAGGSGATLSASTGGSSRPLVKAASTPSAPRPFGGATDDGPGIGRSKAKRKGPARRF